MFAAFPGEAERIGMGVLSLVCLRSRKMIISARFASVFNVHVELNAGQAWNV